MAFLKRLTWTFLPLFLLLMTGEIAVRLRYFFFHGRDWNYITMPIRVGDTQALDHAFYVAPETPARPSARVASAAPGDPAAPAGNAAPAEAARGAQMNFNWVRPCRDREVYSEHYHKPMPFTWDANCFRGDPMTTAKPAGEIRVFLVGGSTVEDAQPDIDSWALRLKTQLADPRVRVVNAGQMSVGSDSMTAMYEGKLSRFKPDIVLYYEAWNEQTPFDKLRIIDRRLGLGLVSNRVHKLLHYRSALYTYLVEKYSFMTTKDVRLWRIDVQNLQRNLDRLSGVIRHSGARMIFVTQVLRFPRQWKGVDTFDPDAVEALLERLRTDRLYVYDTEEISALNQRLAVFRSIEVCRRKDVPIIDLLGEFEALGDAGRKPMFIDLGHLTWQGDAMVGTLIGQKLAALGLP